MPLLLEHAAEKVRKSGIIFDHEYAHGLMLAQQAASASTLRKRKAGFGRASAT